LSLVFILNPVLAVTLGYYLVRTNPNQSYFPLKWRVMPVIISGYLSPSTALVTKLLCRYVTVVIFNILNCGSPMVTPYNSVVIVVLDSIDGYGLATKEAKVSVANLYFHAVFLSLPFNYTPVLIFMQVFLYELSTE